MGIVALAELIVNGPAQVREWIAQGDPHRALGLAKFLAACGVPDAAELITEAETAIRTARETEAEEVS